MWGDWKRWNMRGDIVHRIYGVHSGRAEDTHFGTHRTVAEAEMAIVRLREQHGHEWAEKYHDRGFVIREATVETDFQIPELPKPRDKYVAVGTAKPNAPGTWDSTTVRKGINQSGFKNAHDSRSRELRFPSQRRVGLSGAARLSARSGWAEVKALDGAPRPRPAERDQRGGSGMFARGGDRAAILP